MTQDVLKSSNEMSEAEPPLLNPSEERDKLAQVGIPPSPLPFSLYQKNHTRLFTRF